MDFFKDVVSRFGLGEESPLSELQLIILVFAALGAVYVFWISSRKNTTATDNDDGESPLCSPNVTILSKLSFGWVSPLIKAGSVRKLEEEELWDLGSLDSAKFTGTKFRTELERQKAKGRNGMDGPCFALLLAFGGEYARAGVYLLASNFSTATQPLLLRSLIRYIGSWESESPEIRAKSKNEGFVIVATMLVVHMLQAVCINQYEFTNALTGLRVRSALVTTIFEKSLRLSAKGLEKYPASMVMSLCSGDVAKIERMAEFGHKLWSTPLWVGLILWSLYRLMGWSTVFGLAALVLTMPLNKGVMKLLQKGSVEQMRNRDVSAKLLTEILTNIKNIKLLALTPFFTAKLSTHRNSQDLPTLRTQGLSLSIANLVWSTGPFLVSFLSLAVFAVIQRGVLKADVVFPALTLFAMLHNPLAGFPYAVSAVGEAKLGMKRIWEFLDADEVKDGDVSWESAEHEEVSNDVVSAKGAVFSWNNDQEKASLEVPELALQRGKLYCIVGSVGSGKSIFLQALLGEIPKTDGTVKFTGRRSIAFVSQTPWILNGSIKENILFGHSLDSNFYQMVLDACALNEDLRTLTDGDETQIGGQGMNLSGGQKARLALARAVYARRYIYLMDDVLSAVDQGVRGHLIENVLGPRGLLGTETRILATNSIEVLREAQKIILLRDGKVVEVNTWKDAMQGSGGIAKLIQKYSAKPDQEYVDATGTDQLFKVERTMASIRPKSESAARLKVPQRRRRKGATTDKEKFKDSNLPHCEKRPSPNRSDKSHWKLYKTYAIASSPLSILLYLTTLVSARLAIAGSDWWVKIWAENNDQDRGKQTIWFYIGVHFAMGFGAAVLAAVQMMVLLVFCSLRASKTLHERMTKSVFHSPMSFFETTPFGNIMARFTSDMYRVDDRIGRLFNSMISPIITTTIIIAVITTATPAILPAIVPLALLYLRIQHYFIPTCRSLSQLESSSKGLALTSIQGSIAGITTIRAFSHQDHFKTELEQCIDTNQRALFAGHAVHRWLDIRLQAIGAGVTGLAGSLAIFGLRGMEKVNRSGPGLSAAMTGLALVNAEKITNVLSILVQSIVLLDAHVVSLERIVEFTELQEEGSIDAPEEIVPPEKWPEKGAISFSNYSTRYRDGLKESLRSVGLDIKAGERIGVIGRTGAGKSSLAMALFRIIEPTQGSIEIDGLNISKVPLQTLRSRLAIIPQDVAIFIGTVRTNLDPLNLYSDAAIWKVLKDVRLANHINALPNVLLTPISESSSNFSTGQKQLLSLARALLRNAKILVLDEATASVDLETDSVLQSMLKGELLKKKTVITIAHRIGTIVDSDRVVALDDGCVAEVGTPAELMRRENGIFQELVLKAGLAEQVIS